METKAIDTQKIHNKARRNGKIDLMRFVFCSCVIIHHIDRLLYEEMKTWGIFSLGYRGYIGVEFFFLVSGWLLAKKLATLDHVQYTSDTLGGETYRFLWNKLRPIIPYHIIISVSMIALWATCYSGLVFWRIFIDRIPSLFFLHRIGLGGASPKDVVGIEWYIFSMLLCMAFLYPLGRRYGRTFRLLMPIVGIMICGALMIKTGYLWDVDQIVGFTYKCNWRALGELLMGMGCYEATCALNNKTFSRWGEAGLACLEVCCYSAVLYYIFGALSDKYDMYALCLLAVAVTISFSEKGFGAKSKLLNNPFCEWLGKVSMPIYLAQAPWLSFLPVFWKNAGNRNLCIVIFLGSIASGVAAYLVVENLAKLKKK